jgi:hypothetical protein
MSRIYCEQKSENEDDLYVNQCMQNDFYIEAALEKLQDKLENYKSENNKIYENLGTKINKNRKSFLILTLVIFILLIIICCISIFALCIALSTRTTRITNSLKNTFPTITAKTSTSHIVTRMIIYSNTFNYINLILEITLSYNRNTE